MRGHDDRTPNAHWLDAAGYGVLVLLLLVLVLVWTLPDAAGAPRLWQQVAAFAALAGAALLVGVVVAGNKRLRRAHGRMMTEAARAQHQLNAAVEQQHTVMSTARAEIDREQARIQAMLRDANHRIGNSLSTVSSLLGLQAIRAGSDPVRDALESARGRVYAIASAHRRLRLMPGEETVTADEFLQAVLEDLEANSVSAGKVTLRGEFAPVPVGAQDALALSVLVSELVTNAYRHGFAANTEGEVAVTLLREGSDIPVLRVADTGVGGTMPVKSPGMGAVVVKQLAQQFGSVPEYGAGAGGGLVVTVPLPKLVGVAQAA